MLYAARHILAEAAGGLPDSRTGKDLLPMLLQGAAVPPKQRLVDFSRFHTATLWLGPTLAAAGAPPSTPMYKLYTPLKHSAVSAMLENAMMSGFWTPWWCLGREVGDNKSKPCSRELAQYDESGPN